ncbi:MAG: NADH-quinone oxidoreductase subunit M [Chromatiales bacterium]|jgi:NADH-quinone oxidoreductase subunit M
MIINEIPWTTQSSYPILAGLQLLPVVAILLIQALKERGLAVPLALLFGILELGLAIVLLGRFDPQLDAMQFAERLSLIPPLTYHAAVDGVSLMFILLTAFITLMVVIYAEVRDLRPRTQLHTVVFALQASLMSMFCAMDLLWFTLASSIEVGLLGYLIARWTTSPDSETAQARYYQFVGTGLLLLFTGLLMLAWNYADASGGAWTFDLLRLTRVPVAPLLQSVVFFLLFYGLAVRIPLFPMHGWLPLVAEHGDLAVAPVFLIGLKVGIYGLLRFVLPLLPEAVIQWHQFVVAFAVAGTFYAALLAMLQVNLRRLLAFAVVSHTSILVIGLFSLNLAAFQGSIMLAMDFGLAITTLLFTIGMVYQRTRTVLLSRLGGLFDSIPLIGITFLLGALAIVGMPGTPGFDAAHLVLEAAIDRFGALVTIAAALGNVVAVGFLLRAFQRAFLAPADETQGRSLKVVAPTRGIERLIAGVMILTLLGVGFHSEPWLNLIERSLEGLSELYTPGGHG